MLGTALEFNLKVSISPSPWSIFFDLCMLYDFVQFVGSLQILSIKHGVHILSGHDLLMENRYSVTQLQYKTLETSCSRHLHSQNSIHPSISISLSSLLELITFWEWWNSIFTSWVLLTLNHAFILTEFMGWMGEFGVFGPHCPHHT